MKRLCDYQHHSECSDTNFYAAKAKMIYPNFEEFYQEFADADVNMNLIFRWDIRTNEDGSKYCQIFFIQQRKGVFLPARINNFEEADEADLKELLKAHWKYLKDIWMPISCE